MDHKKILENARKNIEEAEQWHKRTNVREIVFGFNDGSISLLALLAGVTGGSFAQDHIIVVGISGVIAGAISMGIGAYISSKSEIEHHRSEINREKIEIEQVPEVEKEEIRIMYRNKASFNDEEINEIRKNNSGIKIIAHPECPPDVINASDFTGSTSGMIKYVKDNQPEKIMMVTECSMSDNVQIDNPNVEFIRPCNLCPHMKKITLPKILDCLENESNELIIDSETIEKARKSVERMAEIGR